jgi:Na+-transporting methylmalonyl-CoA/oxaloacetate decarboxylase gamma subunit
MAMGIIMAVLIILAMITRSLSPVNPRQVLQVLLSVLAAMKRMETTLDAMKLGAPTVHQIN